MQIIIDDYERGLDSTSYDNLREQMNVSRIMLDILLILISICQSSVLNKSLDKITSKSNFNIFLVASKKYLLVYI
jgi:hypothetical protein